MLEKKTAKKSKFPPGRGGSAKNTRPHRIESCVYRRIFNESPEGIMIFDADTAKTVDVNASLAAILHCTREEFLEHDILDMFSMEDLTAFRSAVSTLKQKKTLRHQNFPLRAKDGRLINVVFTCRLLSVRDRRYVECSIREMLPRQPEAGQKLEQSELRYKTILESIDIGYYEVDLKGNLTFFNDALCRISGYSREVLTGIGFRAYTEPATVQAVLEAYNQVYQTGKPGKGMDYEILTKDGGRKFIDTSIAPLRDSKETIIGFHGIVRDMTEHKQMKDAIAKSELKYRAIVESAQEGIFQLSPRNRRISVNRAFADMLGYDSAKEAEEAISNIPKQVYVRPDEYWRIRNIVEQEGGIKRFETEFYKKDKTCIWVSMSISSLRDKSDGILYYHGIVEDITPKKKLERERQDSIDRLRKSLGATINAMSATVEARDPYTAGHQRRVADLARAIATEMKLPRDQIDGIRLAGMIHDLGKISVPSEILTKPTRLTELEFELIKTHSEAGYNILKDIDFPWPIARMVLEHHERINGSGYPQGLKEDEILLESKIISVADVVEAISSNRPYRPAFGMGPALEEIAKNSGIIYDEAAARSCLKLFEENRYHFPQ
jgi:PAS domain S-box-containing protein